MRQYRVYRSNEGEMQAVKIGWNWPAFFFDMIWALIKRLWLVGLSLAAFSFALGVFEAMDPSREQQVELFWELSMLAIKITLLIRGNELVENNLRRKGFTCIGTFTAANRSSAIAIANEEFEQELVNQTAA